MQTRDIDSQNINRTSFNGSLQNERHWTLHCYRRTFVGHGRVALISDGTRQMNSRIFRMHKTLLFRGFKTLPFIAAPAGRATSKIWAKYEFFGQRQGTIWEKQNFCAMEINTKCRKKFKMAKTFFLITRILRQKSRNQRQILSKDFFFGHHPKFETKFLLI